MKILLVTQYFYPENFKSNDIAFELAKRGYDVTVLTGLPNYPKGKIYKGYGIFKKRKETVNGVKIIRTLVIPRGKGGGMMLALNYISWAVIASFRAFFLALNKKFDTVIVHETSPITQGFPALVIKKIQSIPIYFWVLDLWPESLQSAGGINNRYVLDFFTAVTRLMYRKSDKILISSRGFRQSILEKGDFADKLIYFPNWAEDIFSNINKSENLSLPELPNGFRIIFAGNIGEAQDFEHVMKAALLLKENKSIKFILIGDGRKKLWVDNFINKNNLNDTVYAIGRFPIETMPYFFSKADVMLLSLKDDYIFSLTAPAKLQAYMAAKKPVVAMINGEARNLIAESGCGLSVPACDSKGLADNILELQAMHPDKLKNMGLSGFNYYKKYFTKDICITNLENILKNNEAD
ncbi:MAG: glycosyltransferase family 4 protein [Bacteroidetes bacterium]|uniref:Glycosyltransferase family 4 protein n=1 Tax=Candidatus Limisoma faecipullorum TaxID=2840854 RepID=A0A9D9IQF6_9BACT|nr:glycosyltransferase family 4 protein [Candidatus Limisoma faecipullorum]